MRAANYLADPSGGCPCRGDAGVVLPEVLQVIIIKHMKFSAFCSFIIN